MWSRKGQFTFNSSATMAGTDEIEMDGFKGLIKEHNDYDQAPSSISKAFIALSLERREDDPPQVGLTLREALTMGHADFPEIHGDPKCIDLMREFDFPRHNYTDDKGTHIDVSPHCFGTMQFQGIGSRKAAFIRTRPDALKPNSRLSADFNGNPATASVAAIHAMQVAHYGSHFQPPTLIISVTGGAKSFSLPKRLQDMVQNGLVRAAEKSHAWVVTGGSNSGVMQLTGSILSKLHSTSRTYSPPLIGIATWGIVRDRQQLLLQEDYDIPYTPTAFNHVDANHSHFLFVDDKSDEKFGREIEFRGRFEREAARIYNCPAVTIVVQGGPGTLNTAIASVEVHHPIVVIDGSGLVADLIAYTYNFLHSTNVRYSKYSLEGLARMIQRMFPDRNQDDMIQDLLRCVQIPSLVVVYNLQDDNGVPIDEAILKAVFINEGALSNKLKQAMFFDRLDTARQALQQSDQHHLVGKHDPADLDKALSEGLMYALLYNKPEFVDLYMTFGAKVAKLQPTQAFSHLVDSDLLSEKVKEQPAYAIAIGELYYRSAQGSDSYIKKLAALSRDKTEFTTKKPGANQDYNMFSACHMERLLSRLAGNSINLEPSSTKKRKAGDAEGGYRDDNLEEAKRLEIDASHSLFLWAVCVDNFRIARLFWRAADESIPSALLASSILGNLSSHEALKGPHLADERKKMAHNRDKFEELATGVLEFCHASDNVKTAQLLHSDTDIVKEKTTMELARVCHSQSFIAHPATQAVIDKDWFGNSGEIINVTKWFRWFWLLFALGLPFIFLPLRAIWYSRPNTKRSGYCTRLGHIIFDFYTPPFTRFILDIISHISLCCLFSFMVLVDYEQGNINEINGGNAFSLTEYILIAWFIVIIIEEVRQLKEQHGSVADYFDDAWNYLDIFNISVFVGGLAVRATGFQDRETQVFSKTIFSFAAIGLILRAIRYYSALEFLGPKLIMMQRMMKDVWAFILLLGVFLIGYGVAAQSLMFPLRKADYQTLENVFFRPYFIIYGELFLDEYQDESACVGPWQFSSCTWKNSWLVPVLLMFYLLIANILLVNLLIAMFNDTYTEVKELSNELWRNQNYELLLEFRTKPILPPPVSFLLFPYHFCCRRSAELPELTADLKEFQEWNTERFWTHHIGHTDDETLAQVKQTAKDVNDLREQLLLMNNTLLGLRAAFESSYQPTDSMEDFGSTSVGVTPSRQSSVTRLIPVHTRQRPTTTSIFNPAGHSDPAKRKYPGQGAANYPTDEEGLVRTLLADEQVPLDRALPAYDPPEWTAEGGGSAKDAVIPPSMAVFDRPERRSLAISRAREIALVESTADSASQTFEGRGYSVVNGYPINPFGRTGLRGLGVLYHWGPCQTVDLLITRWRRDETGAVMRRENKRVAEFLAIKRPEGAWALPGTFIHAGETPFAAAWRLVFTKILHEKVEPVGDTSTVNGAFVSNLLKNVKDNMDAPVIYSWDDRNTDNAWIETRCFHISDTTGSLTEDLVGTSSDSSDKARWAMVLHRWNLFASHMEFLAQAAEDLECVF
eukprot:m.138586 g.138586  ORF g.138586 m.138586 type:complete len:1531 (-) comp14013_c0_seq4:2142-6734(-)